MGTCAQGLLRLVRPPNLLTAAADPLAGLLISGAAGAAVGRAGGLVAASVLLYAGGVVLNDVLDREVDARERPSRPIPSGAVSARAAAVAGAALLAAGVAVTFACGGRFAQLAALGLAAAILAYDAALKSTPLGPATMGACRALSFAMGLGRPGAEPLVLGAYVAALTFLAREEVGGQRVARARAGLAGLGLVPLFPAVVAAESPRAWAGAAVFALLGGIVFGPLWTRPDGPTTRRAIGGGILLIPVLDACLVVASSTVAAAAAVAALSLPAMALRRRFSPT